MSVILPDFVDYPELFSVKQDIHIFKNLYCYLIDQYELAGYCLYVGFRDGNVYTRLADWKSNELDLSTRSKAVDSILGNLAPVATLLKSARIPDCLLYFSGTESPVLVDAMISANKFMGPGMLRDLFAKLYKTQVVRSIKVLDDDTIENNHGCIVKPSRFRDMLDGDINRPLYGTLA